jgi:hypothetical protein
MEEMAPTSPIAKKTKEYRKREYDPKDDEDGNSSRMWWAFRCSRAGSVNVNGTDVRAPINPTRSLKKGTAFDTR